ncbi:Y-family DNA polymerase [Paracoccus pacificus]|uniref:Y-family DNA polymerase n=1 Tax=Paracoccus pacificus TaxID=1463598 RepID=A0ABW4R9R0_9RHOB
MADPAPDNPPLALWVEGTHGPVIYAVNAAARRAGVAEGGRLADMRAICPTLGLYPADPQGDAAALDRLALWARRFCPWTAPDRSADQPGSGPEKSRGGFGLVLDTTGADHLWGDEPGMLVAIQDQLAALGYSADLACAPTWGAAWALARFSPKARSIAQDTKALHPLPVAALRLPGETVLLLRRLGLKTVGDLAAIPRIALSRRFLRTLPQDNPVIRLDQASGRLAEPICPPEPPASFRTLSRLAEPVLDPTHHLPGLCRALCRDLAAAGRGARALRLTVWRVDGEMRWITAGASTPSRDPDHIAFLFRERLEKIDPGFGFDLIELAAPQTQTMPNHQRDLGGKARAGPDLPRLLDRLAARFGPGCVTQPIRRARHIPERAIANAPPLAAASHQTAPVPGRPLRLFTPPQEVRVLYAVPEGPPAQFQWHGAASRVARWQGPERIAPEWWADRPGTRLRDYYRVEDQAGRRLWLFRAGLADDGRGAAPRWFVHGEFA